MRRFIAACLLLAINSIWVQASSGLVSSGGRIYDYGDIQAGDTAEHVFVVKNTSRDTVVILSARKSCNCTDVEIGHRIIAPDDSPSAKKLIRRMAGRFSRRYARNYISSILYTYTVLAGGKYRELVGYEGYLHSGRFTQRSRRAGRIKDTSRGQWFPVSGVRSFAWNSAGTDTLPARGISFAAKGVSKRDELKTDYSDRPNNRNVYEYKRMAEVCSPLNPRHLRHFDYWIEGEKDDVWIVGFKTRQDCFPGRVRLYARGIIRMTKDTFVPETVCIEDWVDYWTSFPYRRDPEIPESFTHHKLTLGYKETDGRIVSESAALDISWKTQDKLPDGADYYVSVSRRSKPWRDGLEEHQHLEYMESSVLSRKLDKKTVMDGEIGYTCFYAPFIPGRWNQALVPWLDWDKVTEDLEGCGVPFAEQVRRNYSMDEFGGFSFPPEMDERYRRRLEKAAAEVECALNK